MKKTPIILFFLATMMVLCVSCNGMIGRTSRNAAADSNERSNIGVGILMMEGTALQVDAEQSESLLPLWKAIKNLSNDDNVPEAEMAAVYRQIQEALTSEQLQEIQSADWTGTDISALMEKYDVQIVSMTGSGNPSSAGASQPQGNPGGGMPVGGGPGGPGGDMLGMMGESGSMESAPLDQGEASMIGGSESISDLNVILAEAVIKILEEHRGV